MTLAEVLADTTISGELLAQLPDPGPCELVEGRIVSMGPTGPRHGELEQHLAWVLRNFLEAHPLGKLYVGEVGIYTKRRPDTVRGADLVFISHGRLAAHEPEAAFFTVVPEIVVEILSPGDRAEAIEKKVQEYLGAGALEVWIVDAENVTIRRHRSGTSESELLDKTKTLTTPLLPGFELPIHQLFTE